MVLGIGCDIIEVDRIKKAMAKDRFLCRYFTDREIELIKKRSVSCAHTAAGNFCAKEAVVKALGCGFGDIALKDVEILRNESGAPYALLHGGGRLLFEKLGASNLTVSISHSKGMAMAFAVVEK